MDEETRALHRRFAVDLFNEVWRLLELLARTAAEDDRMLHAAHASRYHWGEIGDPANFARGEWEEHGIGDFDIAFAHEAIARAAAVAGDTSLRDHHLTLARALGAQIAEEDDREIL